MSQGNGDHRRLRSYAYDKPPLQRRAGGASRHWMHDTDPPDVEFSRARRESRSSTRARDFRDYGRGDCRGNVGPDGFGYSEANYGPTRYAAGEYGRTGREPGGYPVERQHAAFDQGFRGRGPKGYTRSDERVHESVCERLTDDPYVDASDMTVTVRNGEVTLAGTVDSRRSKYPAEEIAFTCCGVRDVHNRLRPVTVPKRSNPRPGTS